MTKSGVAILHIIASSVYPGWTYNRVERLVQFLGIFPYPPLKEPFFQFSAPGPFNSSPFTGFPCFMCAMAHFLRPSFMPIDSNTLLMTPSNLPSRWESLANTLPSSMKHRWLSKPKPSPWQPQGSGQRRGSERVALKEPTSVLQLNLNSIFVCPPSATIRQVCLRCELPRLVNWFPSAQPVTTCGGHDRMPSDSRSK